MEPSTSLTSPLLSRRSALLLLGLFSTNGRLASGQDSPSPNIGLNPFLGHWTYRSFLNRQEPLEDMNTLLFAQAELIFEAAPLGSVKGTLKMGDAGSLTLAGSVAFGNPFSIRFQGVGKTAGSPSEGWVYDYIGWYVPQWPHGVDQKSAIVGSVIRSVPHGQAKAGTVASFIAVKRD